VSLSAKVAIVRNCRVLAVNAYPWIPTGQIFSQISIGRDFRQNPSRDEVERHVIF